MSVPGMGYLLLNSCSWLAQELPKQCVAVALGFPLELHGKTLLLKIQHTFSRTQRNQVGID